MKRENIEEANIIDKRIQKMENAIYFYERHTSLFRLFSKPCRIGKKLELGISYIANSYICLSEEQQRELANLIRKWIEEDKRKLETL